MQKDIPLRACSREEIPVQFVPYLNFDGNCAEAMAFYADVFGGQVVHQATFWSTGFGMVTDRFGIPWMINVARAA